MADQKILTLTKKLNKRTLEKKIAWERTVEDDLYQAVFPGYTIMLSQRYNRDSDPDEPYFDYIMQIFNQEGKLVEEVSDIDLASLDPEIYKTMRETYNVARRTAMGVDKAINTLIAELEKEEDDIEF